MGRMPAHRGGSAQTKLAEWRLRRGLSQAELARAVGLPRTTYWRLETGRVRDPKLRPLTNLAIAIALGCPNGVHDLIEDAWRGWYPFDRSTAPEPPEAG
jgi:transcriptional regulator with XRE-family HTH domain